MSQVKTISKEKITRSHLLINQPATIRADLYNSLGTIIKENWNNANEIKTPFGKASSFKIRKILLCRCLETLKDKVLNMI